MSYVLGVMAVLVFVGMTTVHRLSQIGVSDFKLLFWGLIGNTLGYIMLYLLWHRGVHFIAFALPVIVGESYISIWLPSYLFLYYLLGYTQGHTHFLFTHNFFILYGLGAGSFPFLGAPNRSLFSEAVDQIPELSRYSGTMQALLSVSLFFSAVYALHFRKK